MDNFFGLIDPDLRPPMAQVHFPSTENINDYGKMLEDVGGRRRLLRRHRLVRPHRVLGSGPRL